LGVSSSRVSQLLKGARERYLRYDARLRALVQQEARSLSPLEPERDGE
jgi:hypothetical protein